MEEHNRPPQHPEPWEVATSRTGVASDVLGQVIITLFIVFPLIGTLGMCVWWSITLGPRWLAAPLALLAVAIGYGWLRYSRRFRVHSIRFDGEKLWLGRSDSFPPSDVCMLEAFQRPRRALSYVAIWRESVRRYSRVYFGTEALLTVCEKLDELCPHAVKIWMPGEIVLPDGFDRKSPGFSRLRWFFVSRICWNLASGLLFLAWGTAVATDVDNAFEIVMVALLDLVACMGLWRAWRDFRVWKSLRAEIPETTGRGMR